MTTILGPTYLIHTVRVLPKEVHTLVCDIPSKRRNCGSAQGITGSHEAGQEKVHVDQCREEGLDRTVCSKAQVLVTVWYYATRFAVPLTNSEFGTLSTAQNIFLTGSTSLKASLIVVQYCNMTVWDFRHTRTVLNHP